MSISDSDYQGRFTDPHAARASIRRRATRTSTRTTRTGRRTSARSAGFWLRATARAARFRRWARTSRRWRGFTGRTRPDDADVYVAAAGGAIYTYTMGTEGWVKRSRRDTRATCGRFVTYEAAEGGATVDILILSNEKDGMIAVYGSDLRVEKQDADASATHYERGEVRRSWGGTRSAFGARAQRDTRTASSIRAPTTRSHWTDVPETPELGGGVINQPTWDGDKFISLEPFGGYLLAVKERTIFEIRGTDPEQLHDHGGLRHGRPGGGAAAFCTDRTSMLYLSQSGIGLIRRKHAAAAQPGRAV